MSFTRRMWTNAALVNCITVPLILTVMDTSTGKFVSWENAIIRLGLYALFLSPVLAVGHLFLAHNDQYEINKETLTWHRDGTLKAQVHWRDVAKFNWLTGRLTLNNKTKVDLGPYALSIRKQIRQQIQDQQGA